MASSLNEHLEGCTPLKPCSNCQVVAFARKTLKSSQMTEFTDIAGPEISVTNDELEMPVELLNLSTRAENCLLGDKVEDLKKLLNFSEEGLLAINGMGQTSVDEIKKVLKKMGYSLAE